MVHLVARRRPSSSPCCTYCRGADAPVVCDCGACYHADCRVTLGRGRCSTIGCGSDVTQAPRCSYCLFPAGGTSTCSCGIVYHPACRDALALGRCWSPSCSAVRPSGQPPSPLRNAHPFDACVVSCFIGGAPGLLLGLAVGVLRHIVFGHAPRVVLDQVVVGRILGDVSVGTLVGVALVALLYCLNGKLPRFMDLDAWSSQP